MRKILYALGTLIFLFGLVYILGPKESFDPISYGYKIHGLGLDQVEQFIEKNKPIGLKPENGSQIIWANGEVEKTNFVLVYLNGFSASKQEGAPINENFAKRYGMNFYFPRLEGHGIDNQYAFENYSPDAFYDSAEKAIEVAKILGDSIIIMSCSTGGTLSVLLAGRHPEIHSYIMFSPNIDIADPRSGLMTGPWGKRITQLVLGGDFNNVTYTPEQAKYWYPSYHIDGLIALKHVLNKYMTSDNFANIKEPLFMGYFYKNDEVQDRVVSVPQMHKFFDEVSTPNQLKQKVAYADAGNHVISSSYMNKNWKNVQDDVFEFAEQVLHLNPVLSN